MPEYSSGNAWVANDLYGLNLTAYPYLSRSRSTRSADIVVWRRKPHGHTAQYAGGGVYYGAGRVFNYPLRRLGEPGPRNVSDVSGDPLYIDINWRYILFGP